MSGKRLTGRQRYLLDAAFNGRVFMDVNGGYWLDRTSRITVEFRALVANGWAREPIYTEAATAFSMMRRVLWVADEPSLSSVSGDPQ